MPLFTRRMEPLSTNSERSVRRKSVATAALAATAPRNCRHHPASPKRMGCLEGDSATPFLDKNMSTRAA